MLAAGLLFALALTVLAFSNLLRSQQRAHTRERDLLLNQLLHLAGKPWQPAPAEEQRPAAPEREPHAPRYTARPEAFGPAIGFGELAPLEPADLIPSDWSESQ